MKQIVSLLVLMLLPAAYGDLTISGFLYDPSGTDTGQEWIELRNEDNESADLSRYALEKGNGANPDDWTEVWVGSGSVAAQGLYLVGESGVVPSPDDVVSLGLQNGPDGLRLLKDGSVVETVGWGEHTFTEYYEGTPVEDSSSGEAYIRVSSTGDNAADFVLDARGPSNSATQMISIVYTVDRAPAIIIAVVSEDDDSTTQGVQLSPFPGIVRDAQIEIVVFGSGCASTDIEPSAEMTFENGTHCGYVFNMSIAFTRTPGAYSLLMNTSDMSYAFNYSVMALTAYTLDSSMFDLGVLSPGDVSLITGDADMSTMGAPTLQNIGNTMLDIAVFSTGGGALVSYDFDSTHTGICTSTPQTVPLGLSPGMMSSLTLEMEINSTAESGVYQEQISLLGLTP